MKSKRPSYNTGKRDANEDAILELLKARNVRYTQMRPGDGCDLIVWIHPIEAWEIKDPSQPPSKRKLTDDEVSLMEDCAATRNTYAVIHTVEEAAERLNKYFDRMW